MTISELIDEEQSLDFETSEELIDAPVDESEELQNVEDGSEEYPDLTVKAIMALKPKFMNIIRSYYLESLLPEDVFSAFLTKIYAVSPKYGNCYVDRYNHKSSHTTFLYGPLRNICKSLKDRECSECGEALKHAKAIENAPEREEAYDPSAIYAEHISGGYAEEEASEAKDIFSKLMAILERKYATGNSVNPENGLQRSPLQVIRMMFEGMGRNEIAENLAVSPTYVGLMLDKILKDPEVETLKVAFNGI